MKKSFASRLTTKQVQIILRSVGFSWENKKISSEGWVDVSDQAIRCWEKLSINIYHGGFVDHYFNGDSEGSGDSVDLVASIIYRPDFSSDITIEHKVHAISEIRKLLGRKKAIKNSPRICDIDIIDYGNRQIIKQIILPHPRMHKRNFVLFPLFELNKDWKHPTLKCKIKKLILSLQNSNIRSIKKI